MMSLVGLPDLMIYIRSTDFKSITDKIDRIFYSLFPEEPGI